MARDDPQMKLRLPDELRERIRERSELNGRSMNTEILGALTKAFPPSDDALELLYELGEVFRLSQKGPRQSHEAVFFETLKSLEAEIRRLQKFDVR